MTVILLACSGDSGSAMGDAGSPPDSEVRSDGGQDVGDAEAERDFAENVEDTAYESDPDPDRLDPERGIYYWAPRADDPHTLVGEWLYLGERCDQELGWEGRGAEGTSPVLDAYAAVLEEHRAAGRKVIFRPRYDRPESDALNDCGVFQAQTEELAYRHVEAVAAMLAAYREVIAFVEAGYLGRWGEWNWAGYGPENAPILADPARRRAFLDHVVRTYGSAGLDRFVGVRRPVFARELMATHPESSVHVSLYNDCFMTDASDMGTYANAESDNPHNFGSVEEARTFAQTWTENAPFGGETCPSADPRWASCEAMVGTDSEPASLHMVYLHGAWAADARETWEAGGCYDEIKRRLGYRFEVERVAFPPRVAAGERVSVSIDVRNTGWARLHNPREAFVVLRSEGDALVAAGAIEGYGSLEGTVEGGAAVRDWAPGGTARLSVTFERPPAGSYSVRLLIPEPGRADLRAYAVRLASLRDGVPVWDEATGENDLGVTIRVE